MKRRHKVAALAAVGLMGIGGGIWANWNHHYYPHPATTTNAAAPFTANEYIVASGGSSSCTRHSTVETYTAAVANGNVCGPGTTTSGFANACTVAHGGDVVGVKAGSYGSANSAARYVTGDCSAGLGVDVNPNAAEQGASTGTTANWTTFKCADGNTARTVSLYVGGDQFKGNEHAVYDMPCLYAPALNIGENDTSVVTLNEQWKNVWLGGFALQGAKNILLQDAQIGPSVKCAADDMVSVVGSSLICNASGPWYESQYAAFENSNTTTSCTSNKVNCGGNTAQQNEPFIHNSCGGPCGAAVQPTNIRWQNVWVHDQQTYSSTNWHPGCLITNSTGVASDSNIVIDRLKCERVAVQGIQNEQSGTTIENSVFACSTYPIFDGNNPSNLWALCGNNPNVAIGFSAGLSFSHFIVRYNTFAPVSTAFIWRCGTNTYTTTRMIGNLGADGMAAVCAGTGNVTDRNTSYNSIAGVGTNSESLTGSPLTDYDAGTAYADTTQIDMSLTGSPAVQTIANSAGADYVVSDDYPGTSRVDPTHAGAYK